MIGHVSIKMDKHPYECGGAEEGCNHCQKSYTESHDPRECGFCEADWLESIPTRLRSLIGLTYDEIQNGVMLSVLASVNWHRGLAASSLGISDRTMARWIASVEAERSSPIPRRYGNRPTRSEDSKVKVKNVMDKLRGLEDNE